MGTAQGTEQWALLRFMAKSVKESSALAQDRHCTYDVTLRRVRVTTTAVEEHITYSKCASATLVIQHTENCTRAVLYCHLWPASLYHIFPHYLINGTIFGKKNYWTIEVRFIFSTTFVEIVFILRQVQRDTITNVN